MRFLAVPVDGGRIAELESHVDARGSFARVWCSEELAREGLLGDFRQCNLSYSASAGTLRGLHYQAEPYAEAKLVRCVRGAVFDVMVDVRRASPTFRRWFGVELTDRNRRMLYVPPGCAHGYLTLTPDAEVVYPVTQPYRAETERGVRWNDPAFAVEWPDVGPLTLSDKDRAWPDYDR